MKTYLCKSRGPSVSMFQPASCERSLCKYYLHYASWNLPQLPSFMPCAAAPRTHQISAPRLPELNIVSTALQKTKTHLSRTFHFVYHLLIPSADHLRHKLKWLLACRSPASHSTEVEHLS